MRVRWRLVALPLAAAPALFALGCGPGAAQEPRAIVVGPAGDAGSSIATGEVLTPHGDETAPFDLVLGSSSVCVRAAGRVHCSPDLSPEHALTAAPPLEGIADAIHLALGHDFGCATTRAGDVWCFGDNNYGQLGAGVRAERNEKPVKVVGVTGGKQVVAGHEHACALLGDGTVRCWGRNDSGQTGNATRYLPAARELVTAEPVLGVKDVKLLVAGSETTCAKARTSPLVTCWGRAPFAADEPFGARAPGHPPTAIAELAPYDDLAVSGGAFCGIRSAQVFCRSGARSYPMPAGPALPASVNVAGARRVRVSARHACAVLADGAVTCWGDNAYGALGREDSSVTGIVKGLPSAVDVAVSDAMSCAITVAHEAYCWGSWPQADGSTRVERTPIKIRIIGG